MIGAIIGDIIGSRFEWNNHRDEEFLLFSEKSHFTDDTVLTIATADCLLRNRDYRETYQFYAKENPNAGYGGMFHRWIFSSDLKPYQSFGNGSGMRVSPIGWFFPDLDTTRKEAQKSAEVTHNHPEGIKGAESIASAIFLSRKGSSKEEIQTYIEDNFKYNLKFNFEELKISYQFDETCQGSIPQAIYCFLVSNSFEDAIRKSISIGGDSDTIACMTGSIAEAFYKNITEEIKLEAYSRLPENFLKIIQDFNRYINH